jgi:hypothetical protein
MTGTSDRHPSALYCRSDLISRAISLDLGLGSTKGLLSTLGLPLELLRL